MYSMYKITVMSHVVDMHCKTEAIPPPLPSKVNPRIEPCRGNDSASLYDFHSYFCAIFNENLSIKNVLSVPKASVIDRFHYICETESCFL